MWRPRLLAPIAALALLAVACGGTTTDTTVATTTAPTTTAAPTTTSAPATTPAPTTEAPTTTTEAPAFPVTIAASNGDIEIPTLPTRIVSLSASHTEMLYAIGAGDQVVAVDLFSNFPEGAPVTDMTSFAPNVEAIVDLDADLVVIEGDWDGTSVAAMTELGIPVLVLEAAASFDDIYSQIEKLGVATDRLGDAAALVAEMQTDIDEILTGIEPAAEPRTFYHELDSTFFSITTATFIGSVYEAMGLVNIADAVGEATPYPQLSEEYIIEQDPDLIFLADTICCGVNATTVGERPGWATLTAVQSGGVVEMSDDIASRWGPRIVDFMRTVADALAAVPANA